MHGYVTVNAKCSLTEILGPFKFELQQGKSAKTKSNAKKNLESARDIKEDAVHKSRRSKKRENKLTNTLYQFV